MRSSPGDLSVGVPNLTTVATNASDIPFGTQLQPAVDDGMDPRVCKAKAHCARTAHIIRNDANDLRAVCVATRAVAGQV